MLPQIELFCVGFAAVVDTVLLLVVLERINRPLTAVWVKLAVAGATFWHIGTFLHALLRDTHGATADWLDALCMIGMATGLLLLNCSILHGGLRLNRTGAVAHPPPDLRYAVVYTPLLIIFALAAIIIRSSSRDFIQATSAVHVPYLLWLMFANVTAASLLIKNRDRFADQSRSARRFLIRFSIGIVAVTVLATVYILFGHRSRHEPWLRLLTSLSPLAPTLIFAYYIFRRRLLPMVVERTLVYGALVLAVFYLHRLTLSPLMSKYSREFQFDFVVVEGLLLVALILAYEPLRNRFREGLRYLIGVDISKVRDMSRGLSVELSRRAGDDIHTIADWFALEMMTALHLRYTFLSTGGAIENDRVVQFADEEDSSELKQLLTAEHLQTTLAELSKGDPGRWIDRSRCNNADRLALLRKLDAIAAFPIRYRGIHGALLLGTPRSGDRLSDEQLNTIALLVDQYAATIHNRRLEKARQTAERRAVQQEKLSTLGMVSGSLAHELRNPLSSIRTIATLLGEDLGAESDHKQDVELIVSEIDRLNQTTQRLLDFSRPPDETTAGVAPDAVVERIMHILSHLARQYGVTVTLNLSLGDAPIRATDAALSEILFNLIKNAIEAVRDVAQPEVKISTAFRETDSDNGRNAVVTVVDNGKGMTAEVQKEMFQPFVTGKLNGTGLGLYLVAERIREVNGTLECNSQSTGTTFDVAFPLAQEDERQ